MEDSLRGKLLIASPALVDPNFARAVVLITEHNDEGAMGVVLNRPSETAVEDVASELSELVVDEPVFIGGPVQPQALVVLAEFNDPEAAAWIVAADVGFVSAEIRVRRPRAGDPAGAGLRRLFGLGRGTARGRARRGRLDRRGAHAGGAVPRRSARRCGRTCWPARAGSSR